MENEKTILAAACEMLGWQGGTIHQVQDEIRKLGVQQKTMFLINLRKRAENDKMFLQYMADYHPLMTEHIVYKMCKDI